MTLSMHDTSAPCFARMLRKPDAIIASTIVFVESFAAAQVDGSESRPIALRVGGKDWPFTGQHYLPGFASPNFYFHLFAAYNILRHNGVGIGKGD